ncbi:MAG: hypothetical protein OEL76_10050 [Siculibacillus sp.]|nr:hypothetical protein [Siculibacillus sp.]
MSDAAWFLLAPVLMAVAAGLAYRRWGAADVGGRFARLVLIVLTIGGALGAPLWWAGAPSAFPWLLPPLAGRMLAAAAVAFAVLGVRVLERPTPARVGLHAIAAEVYLAPLVVAILAFHLDHFDWSRPVTAGFFAIAAFLVIGAAPLIGRDRAAVRAEPVAAAALLVAGAILAVTAAALFFVPTTPIPALFPWANDPLTSRLIAVMPATLAVAFVLAARDRSLVADAGIFALVYGVGVVAAVVLNALAGKPLLVVYLVIFGAGAVVGAAVAWRAGCGVPASATSGP